MSRSYCLTARAQPATCLLQIPSSGAYRLRTCTLFMPSPWWIYSGKITICSMPSPSLPTKLFSSSTSIGQSAQLWLRHKIFGGNSCFVVLTIHEPLFLTLRLIHIRSLKMGNDCLFRCLTDWSSCPCPSSNRDLQTPSFEQFVTKLFKSHCRKAVKGNLMLGLHDVNSPRCTA